MRSKSSVDLKFLNGK